MRENPFGLDHPIADQIHLEATAKAIAHLDAGRPVDVLDIISASLPETCRGPSAAQHGKPYRLRIQSGFITVYPESRQHQYQPGRSLAGEHEALFESGGRASGAVKRRAGRSPDDPAQLAHESGFIDEADAALLKETLERAEPATRFIRLRGTSSSARWVWKSSEIFGPGPKPKRPPTLTN